jgi:hypothetical protein
MLRLFLWLVLLALPVMVQAQKKEKNGKNSLSRKAFKEGLRLITTTPKDTITAEKSVNPFLEYSGKIIRTIHIDRIGFEKSIYDSAKKVNKWVTQAANFLHVNTREKIIRQHLFVQENKPLNPHKLADNERFLRDKDFILDSRIVVIPLENPDSIDLLVITRDVFSLGATVGGSFPTAPEIGVYDANVDGRAQRLQFTSLIDQDRTPKFGYSALYRRSSVFGSLTNLSLYYTELNDARSFGQETEFAYGIKLDRALVSPYSRLAGGLEVSNNWSENVYQEPESTFADYQYKIFDAWLGYNIGIKRGFEDRKRRFFSMRYVDGYYQEPPEQPEYEEEVRYNSMFGYLSEFTFYKQNFYKTRYVFGFGRTEDIPYGYKLSFTAGYLRQLQIERPYLALKYSYGIANKKGDFHQFNAQAGGYYRNEKIEDAVIQVGAGHATRIWSLGNFKMRNYLTVGYTQLFNNVIGELLDIGRAQIPGFSTDSLEADKRFALHLESILFTPLTFLGFRFASFVAVDMSAVDCVYCVETSSMYWGLSSGFRTRNENLIFGTIELKATYIPYDEYGESQVVFSFKQNLRVRNSGSFVRAPSLIKYN